MAHSMQKASNHKESIHMTKSRFQTLPTTHLESTTGGWYARYGYGYGPGPGPYAAERYYAREERFAYNHPYAFARYERRFGW
jgi:hypothetical protein